MSSAVKSNGEKMETYQGTFADIEYDGKIIRIISKDGLQVHPIMPATQEENQFYADLLKTGVENRDIGEWVDIIIEDEACKYPTKLSLLMVRLGKKAFVRDWTRSKGRLN